MYFVVCVMLMNMVPETRFIDYLLIYVYLLCLYVQDDKTYYLSKFWLISSCLCLIWFQEFKLLGLCFCFIASIMKLFKRDWIGSADIFYLGLFGLVLGYERMLVAVGIGLIYGFFEYFIFGRKLIPFVSCLVIGFMISYLKGYSIYYFLYGIFSL